MTELAGIGVPGLDLQSGDHVCGLYLDNAARDSLLLAFLRAGLAGGEKCVCILDEGAHAGVLGDLAGDAATAVATHQLELTTPDATYLSTDRFSSDAMLTYWSKVVTDGLSGGFVAARVSGDVTWMLTAAEGAMKDFVSYESELNRFVAQHPVIVMCLYDLAAFGGGILVDLMKTHPKLILGGMVLENPHCLTADEFLASRE